MSGKNNESSVFSKFKSANRSYSDSLQKTAGIFDKLRDAQEVTRKISNRILGLSKLEAKLERNRNYLILLYMSKQEGMEYVLKTWRFFLYRIEFEWFPSFPEIRKFEYSETDEA